MYFEDDAGVLIEAKDLVNGSSIVQAERVDKVEYFHIELETHDVIVAEGSLSETFIDDGSRGMFPMRMNTARSTPMRSAAGALLVRLAGWRLHGRDRSAADCGAGGLNLAGATPCSTPLRGFVDQSARDASSAGHRIRITRMRQCVSTYSQPGSGSAECWPSPSGRSPCGGTRQRPTWLRIQAAIRSRVRARCGRGPSSLDGARVQRTELCEMRLMCLKQAVSRLAYAEMEEEAIGRATGEWW